MAIQVSEVTISNLALSWLGANLIASLDDDNTEAKLCKANYALSRDAVLEIREWSFALKRASLPEANVGEEEKEMRGGFSAFIIPADAVRIIKATEDPRLIVSARRWYIEGINIWADATRLFIRYIYRIEDPQRYSPNFIHALAARMAADLAVPITGSREMQALMAQLFIAKLDVAGTFDGMQGQNQELQSTALIKSR